MLGLSLWEGRLPGQKTIENEDKGSHCSYRPESNFGTMDTVHTEHVLQWGFVGTQQGVAGLTPRPFTLKKRPGRIMGVP